MSLPKNSNNNLIWTVKFNSIQDYLYSVFHDTIVAKQLYRKSSFYNRFIYFRILIYLTYGKMLLILYILWGPARGWHHLFSGVWSSWIQTEACVIPSYHGMLIPWQKQRNRFSTAVVPSKQKWFVQPKLKHNNVHLIRYNCSTRLWDALYECLAKEMCL